MSPNNLGNYMTVENCRKIRISDYIKNVKKMINEIIVSSSTEMNGIHVELTSTQTNFNGKRLWFICPNCKYRKTVLYQRERALGIVCRKCLGLSYRTQRYKNVK